LGWLVVGPPGTHRGSQAAAYRHGGGIEAPASSTEEDPEGDLAALRQALKGTRASWRKGPYVVRG
jgi:hypothetical protein